MIRPNQIWATLPEDSDDEPCTETLFDQDSYIVELSTGEQLWAVYTRGSFVACDDDGNEIASPGMSCPMPLDNVRRVLVRGYAKGFGPSCPRAGEPQKIGLVVVQPSKPGMRAESLVSGREPVFSSERDARVAS